jgi:hypothetical protein
MGGRPSIFLRGIRHLASPLGRSGRPGWADRSIRSRRNGSRGWFGPWRLLASNFPSPMREVSHGSEQVKLQVVWKQKGCLPYFRSGRLIVAECSGTVSK